MQDKAICVFCGQISDRRGKSTIYIKCPGCVKSGKQDLLPIEEFRKKKEEMFASHAITGGPHNNSASQYQNEPLCVFASQVTNETQVCNASHVGCESQISNASQDKDETHNEIASHQKVYMQCKTNLIVR